MKRILTCSLLIAFSFYCAPNFARAEVSEANIKGLSALMQGPLVIEDCGTMPYLEYLYKNVPAPDQADTVAELVRRTGPHSNNVNVALNEIYLAERIEGPPTWNVKLESALLPLTESANPSVRFDLVQLFLRQRDVRHRERIIPLIQIYLADKNEYFRATILEELFDSGWPEGKEIAEEYLKDTPPTPEHQGSIFTAKTMANPTDDKRAEVISDQIKDPHALEKFKAYIAEHKGDPDYEVSVHEAGQWVELFEENARFEKSHPELKN